MKTLHRTRHKLAGVLKMSTVSTVLLTVAACGGSADAGGAESESYNGETVTIVVSASPGGGFDTLARTLEPYLREELGATIVIENQAGGGGLIAFNEVARSDVDENMFCLCQMGPFITSILQGETTGLEFDISELTYMGNLQGFGSAIVTSTDSRFETMDDVIASEVPFRFATPGEGAASDLLWPLLVRTLNLAGAEEPITGYPGTSELALGTLRGDIDGFLSTVGSIAPQLESGELRPLLAMDYNGNIDLGGAATVDDLPFDESGRELIDTFIATNQLKRTLVGPPDVPGGKVEQFRSALERIVENENFLADAEAARLEISLTPGADVATRIPELLDPPARFRELLNDFA